MGGQANRLNRGRRYAWVALAALVVPSAAAGQRTDEEWLEDCADRERRNERYVYCDVRVETMRSPSGTLRVDAGRNGGVQIIGENRQDVEIHARIQAWSESRSGARSLADAVEVDIGRGTIAGDGPSTEDGESWSIMFVIRVPRRSDLDLQAHNGPISIENVSGTIAANTQNGPLSLEAVSGDVSARTQNGPLNVVLEGARWNGEGLDAETRNGPVNLTIPENFSARFETGTVNGPFRSEIPLTVTRLSRRDMRVNTTLGNGGPPVRVVTTNGPVSIRTAR